MKNSCILFRILMILYLVFVGYLCFSTLETMPQVPYTLWGFESDKVGHFLMFAPFPFLAYFSLRNRGDSFWKTALILIAICIVGAAYGASTEIIQGFLPQRVRDIEDFVADMYGISLGLLFTLPFAIFRRRK